MSESQAVSSTQAPSEFSVRLSTDRLRLYVSAPDPHADLANTAARLSRELPGLDLAVDIGIETLLELLSQACRPGEHLIEFPLLTGEEPQPPRDGKIQWQDDFFAEGFVVDEESGKIDYWERAEKRAVSEGQLLAVLLLPQEGKPGRTLLGDEVPVPKPTSVRLRAGKGVRTEEQQDRVLYQASTVGRIHLKDGTVSVDEVYMIRGDVGLETGNIEHNGTLVIQGDVKENVRIECDGEIMIKGMVEPADIVCGGSLTVGGGIVGDKAHRIEVKGTLEARYLNDVNVRCGGDVTITSQIDHSQVECSGKVTVLKGRIAGGMVKAYQGIEVGNAGASGARGTVLIPGACWQYEEKNTERKDRLVKLQTVRDKINATIAQLMVLGELEAPHQQTLDQLKTKLVQVERGIENETAIQARESEEHLRGAVREVAVLIQLYAGVTFRIGKSQTTSDRNYEMPRLVALRRDKVRILPMGELNTPA
jgi:uncharacterized protein